MQLTIDIGNSSIKAGLFPAVGVATTSGRNSDTKLSLRPVDTLRCNMSDMEAFHDFITGKNILCCLLSTTSTIPKWIPELLKESGISDCQVLQGTTPLPVRNLYETPETLGTDRISSAIGAYYLSGCKRSVLCIDSGTALTYDIVNCAGEYLGGNISPGLAMRFRSLHDYTSRLPLLSPQHRPTEIGTSTESAIVNGVMKGMSHEIEGFIKEYSLAFPNLDVYLTGGDALDFDLHMNRRLKKEKNLVLIGLNIILNHIHEIK